MNTARSFIPRTAIALAAVFGAAVAFGQAPKSATPAAAPAQQQPETITIPLSRPGDPMTMHIDILSARIEVIGEERKDVSLAVTLSSGRRKIVTPSGPKMLAGGGSGLEISERDNSVSVESSAPPTNRITIVARVPRRAALNLSTVNEGEIIVRDIVGDLELENINGPITASNINGSVIAESVNNPIAVGLAAVAAGGATSLSSLNGDITLTLPASAKAELHLDTSRGEMVSDFELDVKPSKPRIERNESRGGVNVRMEDVVVATVNGGGPVIRVKTLNGAIKIAKGGG
jgi:hypothetical protein